MKTSVLAGSAAIALLVFGSVPTTVSAQAPSGSNELLNPAHPEAGTIGENIAMRKTVPHIPSKPWALMGWSAANRLTAYTHQWVWLDSFHSRAECLAGHQEMITDALSALRDPEIIDKDVEAEAVAGARSSKCIKVGEEIPLKWEMLVWNATKNRWVKVDRFTTKAECEGSMGTDPDIRAKCVPIPNSK